MQVLEHSPVRLVLQSRHKLFRALGIVLLLVPLTGLILIAHSAVESLGQGAGLSEVPSAMLVGFAALFVAGLLMIVYGPYRVTHIFDRERHAYFKDSTSVRRTRRVELPLETFRGVEVQEQDDWGYRVVLVDSAGKRLPLGEPTAGQRDQVDAVAELVESFLASA